MRCGAIARAAAAALLAAAGTLLGCEVVEEIASGTAERDVEVFGRSVEGRPIEGTIIGSGKETCLLFAVIHGNEPQGAPLLERLAERLARQKSALDGERVVIIPTLNPDGLARGTRANANGVDLNRNFPAQSWSARPLHGDAPGSEPETRAILKALRQFRPSRILSIHSPLHCVNFDGPAEDIARELAAATGYPLRAAIGYATPGSFGSYAGVDLGIPTITLELPPRASIEDLWADVGPALERFVAVERLAAGG